MTLPLPLPTAQDLLDQVTARVTDPERKAIAVALAVDLAALGSRAMAGEMGLEREFLHNRAQVASLTATEVGAVREAWLDWSSRLIQSLAVAALTA